MPTTSVENYLKAIQHLQGDGAERVKTKEIADALVISLPSVTAMLQSLATDGLVDYEPYRGVRLTEQGSMAALKVIRNHRLVEVFLAHTLGMRWDEVHAEAERLEHALSDKLADRIDAFLGHPPFDPHGDPIPTADGRVRQHKAGSLLDVLPLRRVRIVRVLDQASEVLQYLDTLGLRPNVDVELVVAHPFDGPLELQVGGAEGTVTISRALAGRLLVADAGARPGR